MGGGAAANIIRFLRSGGGAPRLGATVRSFPAPSEPFEQYPQRRRQLPTLARAMASTTTSPSAAATIPPSSPIPLFTTVAALREWRMQILRSPPSSSSSPSPLLSAQPVALVPTMGALHEGHLSLVRHAARSSPHVLVSIFLNPAQFAPHEDLASYPVQLATDIAALATLDAELATTSSGRIAAIFAPPVAEIYPSGFPGQALDSPGSFVTLTPVGAVLEGAARPTFFRGVATVVAKLLNAALPDRLVLGQKDVQQTVVLRRMVRDFLVPTEVVVAPTVRDPVDGLALSSRNVYLGARRRRVAPVLWRALCAAERAYRGGERSRGGILGPAQEVLARTTAEQSALGPRERVRFEVGYVSLADPDSMEEVDGVSDRGAVLSGAIKMLPVEEAVEGEDLGHEGGPAVRLLDNVILGSQEE